jgi:hypothetical protein
MADQVLVNGEQQCLTGVQGRLIAVQYRDREFGKSLIAMRNSATKPSAP